ncbi:hypothetical protein COOONC_28006 [Cooperia oncophora]
MLAQNVASIYDPFWSDQPSGLGRERFMGQRIEEHLLDEWKGTTDRDDNPGYMPPSLLSKISFIRSRLAIFTRMQSQENQTLHFKNLGSSKRNLLNDLMTEIELSAAAHCVELTPLPQDYYKLTFSSANILCIVASHGTVKKDLPSHTHTVYEPLRAKTKVWSSVTSQASESPQMFAARRCHIEELKTNESV